MSGVSILRPQPDEAAPFYHGYIARVTDRLSDGRLVIPYRNDEGLGVSFPEDELLQEAPKWVISAPTGDFAFGGPVTLETCTFCELCGRPVARQEARRSHETGEV